MMTLQTTQFHIVEKPNRETRWESSGKNWGGRYAESHIPEPEFTGIAGVVRSSGYSDRQETHDGPPQSGVNRAIQTAHLYIIGAA